MNANFVFPVRQVATPRPQRPQKQVDSTAQVSRDSNTLRASVLDVALELGLGSNSLVADWMFNNAVREEDENEEPLTPEPSASLAFPYSQSSTIRVNGNTNIINNGTRLSPGAAAGGTIDADVRPTANKGRGLPVAFPDGAPLPPNIPSVPVTPAPSVYSTATGSTKKLKKFRKDTGDGYETDSHLSEGGRKSKEKAKKKAKEEKSDAKVGKDAGLMVDPDQRTRKRSFVDAVRGRKVKDVDTGYATDAPSSKTQKPKKDKPKAKLPKSKDADDALYETDGGIKKSKTKSFFKLSSKSSKPDFTMDRATTPPVPHLKEQLPLPIAQRFATTLASSSDVSTLSLDETTSTASHGTSIPPASLDGFLSTTSLGISLAPAGSRKSTLSDVPPLNLAKLPALSFQPLNVDVAQPPSPKSAPPHLPCPSPCPSPPVLVPSSAQSPGTIRNSQASSESSSSGASNPRSRTTASEISTSFSSSISHQISSPRMGHGLGAGSTSTTTSMSQHSHGYGYGQTQRMDTFGRPSASFRPSLPPSSAAAASAAAAGMMSFQISRDVTTVPLMMRQYQQEQQGHEPLAQIQDDGRLQAVETEQVEAHPRRMSAVPITAPLNISKGGLRIKPSLEKIGLLGLRKDTREQVSATPSPLLSVSPAMAGTPLSLSPNSQTPGGQHGLPHSPSPLQSARSKNGSPMIPSQNSNPANLSLSPHAFISTPNSAITSPVLISPSRSTSRPRLSLNPPPNGNQLVPPNVLAYYDIPPPSPPPLGPLPVPPHLSGDGQRISRTNSPIPPPRDRSRSPIPPPPSNHNNPLDGPSTQFPSAAQLRQRKLDRAPRKLPSDEGSHGPAVPPISNIRRGKESPFPPAPIFQRTLVHGGGTSSSSASDESAESGDGGKIDIEPPPRSPILPGPLNSQEKKVLDSLLSRKEERRSSWIDFGDALSIRDDEASEEDTGSRNDEHDVGSSLDGHGSLEGATEGIERFASTRIEESAYSDRPLTWRRSSEVLKPRDNPDLPQLRYAWDDSLTVGDRNSRWSGSVYSRMSILDEEESNVARDRFVKRVEAMLADGGRDSVAVETERNIVGGVARQNSSRGVGRYQYVPPVPKIPDVFAGSTLRSEAVRMWNKF